MPDKVISLTNDEALAYSAGASGLSAALISAITSLMKAVYSFGQDIGSAIRRKVTNTSC